MVLVVQERADMISTVNDAMYLANALKWCKMHLQQGAFWGLHNRSDHGKGSMVSGRHVSVRRRY